MWTQLALNMRMVQHFIYVAAANLGVSAAQVLLNFGADLNLVDDLARKAHDCIPEMHAIGKWLHFRNFKLQFKA